MATPAVHSRVCASVNRMASRLVFWNHIVRVSHSCGHIEDHCSLGQTDTHTSSSLLLSVRAWRRLWCCQLTGSGCINQFSAKIEDHGRCPFIKLSSNPTPFFSPSQHTLPKEIKKITTPRPSPRIVPPLPPPLCPVPVCSLAAERIVSPRAMKERAVHPYVALGAHVFVHIDQ